MADIAGLDELTAKINQINSQLWRALPEIVIQAAEVVEAEIRARAPVDTGRLVRALDAKDDRRKESASATVQIERSGPDQTEHYAIFQEFGTSKMPARPYFRPGIEAAKTRVKDLMTKELSNVIQR